MNDLDKAIKQLRQAMANIEKYEDKLIDARNFEEYDEIDGITLTIAECVDKINGYKMRKEIKEIQKEVKGE